MNLTPKQLEILRIVHGQTILHGYPPTLDELGAQTGCCKISAYEKVEALILKGALERTGAYSARNLRVTEAGQLAMSPRPNTRFMVVGEVGV